MDLASLQIDKLLQYVGVALGLVATALGLRGHLFDGLARRRKHLEEEYEAAKRFVADDHAARPALLVERSFAFVSGRRDLSAPEIRLIMALPDPTRAIDRVASIRTCVKYAPDRIVPTFHSGLATRPRRLFATGATLVLYLVFALTAAVTFSAGALSIRHGLVSNAIALWSLTVGCAGAAFVCVREGWRITWAAQLIEQAGNLTLDVPQAEHPTKQARAG